MPGRSLATRYVWADLVRNPRRTLSTTAGVALGVGLSCAVLFFVDGLSASMTQRAVAPLPVDMQQVLVAPVAGDLRLHQELDPAGTPQPGQTVRVHLELANEGAVVANEVILRSVPAPGLDYVADSARVDGDTIAPGPDNPFLLAASGAGHNFGALPAGAVLSVDYDVEVAASTDLGAGSVRSTASSRESLTPVEADASGPTDVAQLADAIAAVDGVDFAEPLAFADLEPGALSAGSRGQTGPVRVFGFGPGYASHDPTVDVVEGDMAPGEALLSAEAAAALSVGTGDQVTMALPDGSSQDLDVGGIVDLSRARSLFSSRQGADLETFVYVPTALVVDAATFDDLVGSAFARAATERNGGVTNPPVHEVDIGVARDRLDADPGTALIETQAIGRDVAALAGPQDYLLDNISNTLSVARGDAAVAKRLFLFLGVPGVLLASILAGYAGNVLAGAQRREQATLRIRGASRRFLLGTLAWRVVAITALGAVVGVSLGYLTAAAVIGQDTLTRASTSSLVLSGLVGTAGGMLATFTALYITGRRSIDREINQDRARLLVSAPVWRRYGLDVALVVVVAGATAAAIAGAAFEGTPGSVYVGRSVRLPLWLLVLPVGAWLGGCLLAARGFAKLLGRRPARAAADFDRPVSALVRLSLRRRAWAVAEAAVVVSLIVALGVSLAVFTASYDSAKAADAEFVLGGDLRITPVPSADPGAPEARAGDLEGAGVQQVAPVVFGVHNAVVRSSRTEELSSLAAVEPRAFAATAPVQDDDFPSGSAATTLGLLGEDPQAVLLSQEMADFLEAQVGDTLPVLLARGTAAQAETELALVGLFERLPGFPEGLDALMDIGTYRATVPAGADYFLVRTDSGSDAGLDRVVDRLGDTPFPLQIDSRTTVLARDQSSLAALNIRGLLDLDAGYALAMSAVTIAIFVFGLLLQRRREYVVLRAQGLSPPAVRGLIAAEAATVAVAGCIVGVAVGWTMAWFFVNVLRPLFVLPASFAIAPGATTLVVGVVLLATAVASVLGSHLVNRLEPTELLRDE